MTRMIGAASIFSILLLLMVKNKKVTINNTNILIDSTSTTTNYNDIYNDNIMNLMIITNEINRDDRLLGRPD